MYFKNFLSVLLCNLYIIHKQVRNKHTNKNYINLVVFYISTYVKLISKKIFKEHIVQSEHISLYILILFSSHTGMYYRIYNWEIL